MDEADGSEGWEGVLEHLQRRREVSRAMGGEERLQKHRAAGKLDVRARIDHLLDPGSFQELGTLVGGEEAPADAIVIGSGRIDGRPVMVARRGLHREGRHDQLSRPTRSATGSRRSRWATGCRW